MRHEDRRQTEMPENIVIIHLRTTAWLPAGKRKQGRSRETWRRTVERELEKEGLRTRAAAASAAEDRTAWRQRAYGPILHLENG